MSVDHQASFNQPPELIEVDGDILLRAPNGEASYTRAAMRLLLIRLTTMLDKETGRSADDTP
ncbi:MAG: hypothetical protein ACT6TH_00305 [Brevundimonas sp.]|jgi:hypothetical protein|uniref:hypothetical protein n=1 Tax=Brevundimonas sp. TaxID=1871086 RepID=UPI004033A0CD